MPGLDIKLAVSSGIPEAYTATLNYAAKVRETMAPDIVRRHDLIQVALCEWFWFDVMQLPRPTDPK